MHCTVGNGAVTDVEAVVASFKRPFNFSISLSMSVILSLGATFSSLIDRFSLRKFSSTNWRQKSRSVMQALR